MWPSGNGLVGDCQPCVCISFTNPCMIANFWSYIIDLHCWEKSRYCGYYFWWHWHRTTSWLCMDCPDRSVCRAFNLKTCRRLWVWTPTRVLLNQPSFFETYHIGIQASHFLPLLSVSLLPQTFLIFWMSISHICTWSLWQNLSSRNMDLTLSVTFSRVKESLKTNQEWILKKIFSLK